MPPCSEARELVEAFLGATFYGGRAPSSTFGKDQSVGKTLVKRRKEYKSKQAECHLDLFSSSSAVDMRAIGCA